MVSAYSTPSVEGVSGESEKSSVGALSGRHTARGRHGAESTVAVSSATTSPRAAPWIADTPLAGVATAAPGDAGRSTTSELPEGHGPDCASAVASSPPSGAPSGAASTCAPSAASPLESFPWVASLDASPPEAPSSPDASVRGPTPPEVGALHAEAPTTTIQPRRRKVELGA